MKKYSCVLHAHFLTVMFFLVLGMPAQASDNDSECVTMKNNTLFNQCNFAVDVSFCVENPRQTKNFFDGSEAFKCPNGGLSTLHPGYEEGNILNGKVHWFACSTEHRGKSKWRYVKGSGYKGRCFSKDGSGSAQTQAARNTAVASEAECKILEGRMRPPYELTTHDMRRNDALMAIEYLDRSCGNLTPEQRADARKIHHDLYLEAVAECKQARGAGCDAQSRSDPTATVQNQQLPSFGQSSNERLSSQDCAAMKQAVIATKVPPNASVTDANEAVMFMTKTIMNMIDGGCPTEPGVTAAQITAERQLRQQQYEAAESACNAVQSGGRRCVPKGHVVAVKEPARSVPSVEMLVSHCSQEIKVAAAAFYAAQEEASRVNGRSHVNGRSGGMSHADWLKYYETQRAREDASMVLQWPPAELRKAHTGALQEAAARANGYANDKSRHDPHHEAVLLKACLIKARIDGL